MVRNFCIARRLVEAGARVVSLNFSRWDWHGGDGMNFVNRKRDFPLLDTRPLVAAHRPARARPGQGRVGRRLGRVRPHAAAQQQQQPRPLAAGELPRPRRRRHEDRPGDRRDQQYAEHPVERPVKFQEVFATLYANAGLNLNTREFDLRGRPQYLVEPGIEPIRELM